MNVQTQQASVQHQQPQQDTASMFAQLFVLGFIAWMFWEVFLKDPKPSTSMPKF